ncbi:MAG: hypothetical protein KKE42_01465 [Alphaproteobacteria bacterium]|uniref:hypothetical protein n=1 Tax=Brevundimonas sp. TaxID=1871086 RepID=UPI00180B7E6B|nr:hypothetical protein [Brevundimonas sp.]MBU3971215.1 hypothetical protein [Alphaproteobacteria bacterium]MBA3050772.1 hypothetical protein [Brevundimonas sp.]MBU3972448.1 hypothetical protein [Alphaproteobacteria bacterium]MBU4040898.1 hypothetical protein [Alphaproteobacteria bacterium]MBU4137705.1 hypothetical protein [Alphaproteobacteria bacterium]
MTLKSRLFLLPLGVWSLLALIGVGAIYGVWSQDVAGFPNQRQLIYYVAIPALLATVSLVGLLFAPKPIGRGCASALALAVFGYLFFFTGGA